MKKTLIVAEIAQGHEGSFNQCFAFIDAAKLCGADAVKFQTHIAEEESTTSESWRKKFSFKKETRYEYWKRMEFSFDEWQQLKNYTHKKGLYFMSTPFSEAAVELLKKVDIDFWKVGSGEVLSYNMLDKMIASGKHIYVSTGMSSWEEMDEFIGYLKKNKAQFTILQCTTAYPCDATGIGLNILSEIKKRYHCDVGFSDHSGEIFPALVATYLGASIIEVHFTLSKFMFGPDISSSLDIEQLKTLVQGIRFVEKMRDFPVNKDTIAKKNIKKHRLFYKRAIAKKNLEANDIIRANDFEFKKPQENGIPELEFRCCIGKKIIKPIAKGGALTHNHFVSEDCGIIQKQLKILKKEYTKCAIKKEKFVL